MTVSYFSPLPPARSGIADYSAALLPELRKFGDVRVSADKGDPAVYQLGNNLLHREIYLRALAHPGVAVIHDALLHHFFLGSLTEAEYLDEFVYNYGEWSRAEAQTLWRHRASSGYDVRYFERPMLKRIASISRAVIVHNPEARDRVLRHCASARVQEIPHFFIPTPAPDPYEVLAFRGGARYLFGVFGYLREAKRLPSVLKAFARLRRIEPGAELLVAGEFHSPQLEIALEPLLQAPGVRRMGHMTEAELSLALHAVDCGINLRYPSAGETSGIATRLMGIGKPVICTQGRELASLPAGTCLPIEPGVPEEAYLFESICLLAAKPEIGREMGRRASAHILRYHSMQAVSEQYWKVLCEISS